MSKLQELLNQTSTISKDVLIEKYCKAGETTVDEVYARVAKGLASVEAGEVREDWEKKFLAHMYNGGIGAGRIMSAAGTGINATLINCFRGDTIALTKQGPGKLKDLVGQTRDVVTVDGWRPATFQHFGKQELFEIIFENGQAEYATANHRWLVANRSRTGDLVGRKEVVTVDLQGEEVPYSPPAISRPEKNEDFNIGVVHGAVYGDGSKLTNVDGYIVILFGEKRQLAPYFNGISRSVRDCVRAGLPAVSCYRVVSGNRDLKALPSNDESDSYKYGFICGLIATDGNVSGSCVSIFSKSSEQLSGIMSIASSIGFSLTTPKLFREFSPYDGSFKPCYILRFIRRYFSTDDLIRSDQADNFSNNQEASSKNKYLRVLSVKSTGVEEDVYCAVEPVTQTFTIRSGILTRNCFVQPVGDSLLTEEGDEKPGIYNALAHAAKTMSKGGGVGYNFSAIRPKKSYVRGTQSHSSGPCSYLDTYNASGKTIESAGSRRAAMMGVLNIDHPDIMEFVTAKQTPGRWDYFNVSVGVSEAFMQAVESDSNWELVHKEPPHPDFSEGTYQREDGKYVYEIITARDLFNEIMKSTYDFAEPGIIFLDTMNRENNLYYCETIDATNPCSEQPLPDYGCCDLGPIILTQFVKNPFTAEAAFDLAKFNRVVALQVRMLDNVLDYTSWPLPEQKQEAMNKRRIGVGYTGIGDTLVMLNMRYGSEDATKFVETIARNMRDSAYQASVDLAKERGAFPLFDADMYLAGNFVSRLPEYIRGGIRKFGIRNSHLLSIAPTGTVSLAFADNASNGIEPAFSWVYDRRKRESDGSWKPYKVMDHAFKRYISEVMPTMYTEECISKFVEAVSEGRTAFRMLHPEIGDYTHHVKEMLPESFVTALELNVDEHLSALFATQPYLCTSQSKTVNVPENYPFEDFCDIYMKAWKGGLKGVSTYRPNSVRPGILTAPTEKKVEEVKKDVVTPIVQEDIDLRDVAIGSLGEGDLPAIKTKKVMTINFEDQNIHIAVSFLNMKGTYKGADVEIMRPVEFFVPQSQIDESPQWVTSTMRTLSLLARQGVAFARALADNRNIRWDKGNVRCGTLTKSDGSVAPRFHSSDVAAISWVIQDLLIRAGYLDESGRVKSMAQLIKVVGASDVPKVESAVQETKAVVTDRKIIPGKTCQECGADAVIKVDGCQKCTSCGWQGGCNG